MKSLMNIGHSKRGIKQYHKSIMQILHSRCDEETKRTALVALKDGCVISGVNVSNCVFSTDKKKGRGKKC